MTRDAFALMALLLLVMGAQTHAQVPPSPDPALDAYLRHEHSVTLDDGRRIHMVCMGTGSPTVVLTAGMGDWGVTWHRVQPDIATLTRVCAWDRPGFGFSSPSPLKQTVVNTTTDLEVALTRGGIRGPYVMVGHSLGGLESVLFTDRHLAEVVGMVLVDPGFPGRAIRLARVIPELLKAGTAMVTQQLTMLTQCGQTTREGKLADDTAESARCRRTFLQPSFPKSPADALLQWRHDAAMFDTAASLVQNNDAASPDAADGAVNARVVNPDRHYGSLPLIVLSATVRPMPPPLSAELLADLPKIEAEDARGHEALAALSTAGVHRRIPDVGHYIHVLKPEVVVEAIGRTIEAARKR